MNGTALDHPLVRAYLRELDDALAALPPGQASELTEQITTHLDEALGPGATDEQIAGVLDRLGRPADLAAEAMPELASPQDQPGQADQQDPETQPGKETHPPGRRLRWPRLGWRRWTAIGAAVAAVVVAASLTASYLIGMATAAPIQFDGGGSGWWSLRDSNHEVDTQADNAEQSTVPIRSGQRQGFVLSVTNPSDWSQAVLGPGSGDSPGSRQAQISVSPVNVDRGGFDARHYRYQLPLTIGPHQVRVLRVMWTSDICLRKGQTHGIGRLTLRVRVGWFTRIEVFQLPEGFYLSGPSHGPCTRGA
jgi:hypothetical protein